MLTLASALRRTVTLRVDTARGVAELGPWLVTVPTALQAIGVYEAVEALGEGDHADGAWAGLAEVLREWLPPSMWSRLLAPDARLTCLMVVSKLVWEGAPEAEKQEGKKRETQALRSTGTWTDVAADVAAVYGAEALSWPWPRFLAMSAAIDGVRARAALVDVDAHLGSKSETMLASLRKRGGYEPVDLSPEEGLANVMRLAQMWEGAVESNPLA